MLKLPMKINYLETSKDISFNLETLIKMHQALGDADTAEDIARHAAKINEQLQSIDPEDAQQMVARLFLARQEAGIAFREGILRQASGINDAPDDMWRDKVLWLKTTSTTANDGASDFKTEIGKRIRPKAEEIQTLLDPRSPDYKRLAAINMAIGSVSAHLAPKPTG